MKMKRTILIIFVIGIMFSGCESPITPDLKEVIENPTAQILLTTGPVRASCYDVSTVVALKEVNGVEVTIDWASIKIVLTGPLQTLYYTSRVDYVHTFITIESEVIPANGESEIRFNAWIPFASDVKSILITVCLVDIYGHEMCVEEFTLL